MRKGKQTTPLAAALRMLARRPYSVAELRRALDRKFPPEAPVSEALTRLRQLGYLDDRKFAEQYASSLARNRAFGPQRIRRELKAKLVDYKHIDPAVAAAFEEVDPRRLLEAVLDRKVRTLKLPLTRQKLASLCQSLLRNGFTSSDIIKAVNARRELKPVAEDIELDGLEAEEGRNPEGSRGA